MHTRRTTSTRRTAEPHEPASALRLLCIGAHPDDETLGMGGALARYAAEGVETHVLSATRGEKGWTGEPEAYPGPDALGRVRERELRESAEVLGVRTVALLDYIDGELDAADPQRAIEEIAEHIRRLRPQVVVTFGHDGIYGHPDHVAISQLTTAALVAAAGAPSMTGGMPPHRVAKLYQRAPSPGYMRRYEQAFGELVMDIDGASRRSPGWADWTITASLDTSAHWEQVWRAVQCHRSQLPSYGRLLQLSAEEHRLLWGCQEYYRAFSLVNGGRTLEDDLFEGLRQE